MSKINKIKIKNTLEEEKKDEDEDEEEISGSLVPAKEYDYLLSMPLWSLTHEKVDELLKNKENKLSEIEILSKTTEYQLWENDIEKFLQVLDVK